MTTASSPVEFTRTLTTRRGLQRAGNRVQLEDENGNPINGANPIPIGPGASGTLQARTTPAAGATPNDAQLMAANTNRISVSLCNISDAVIYYGWGAGAVTMTEYDFWLQPNQVWTLDAPWAPLELRAIAAAAAKDTAIREIIAT